METVLPAVKLDNLEHSKLRAALDDFDASILVLESLERTRRSILDSVSSDLGTSQPLDNSLSEDIAVALKTDFEAQPRSSSVIVRTSTPNNPNLLLEVSSLAIPKSPRETFSVASQFPDEDVFGTPVSSKAPLVPWTPSIPTPVITRLNSSFHVSF